MANSTNTRVEPGLPEPLTEDTFTRYRKLLTREIVRLVKPYDVEDIVQEMRTWQRCSSTIPERHR